jgi:hypothetical protein
MIHGHFGYSTVDGPDREAGRASEMQALRDDSSGLQKLHFNHNVFRPW